MNTCELKMICEFGSRRYCWSHHSACVCCVHKRAGEGACTPFTVACVAYSGNDMKPAWEARKPERKPEML